MSWRTRSISITYTVSVGT